MWDYRSCRILGDTMRLVPATCSEQYSTDVVLFEPPVYSLPAGLLASPVVVQVTCGTVYVPVLNVGLTDVIFYPRCTIGTLSSVYVVSLPSGVTEVQPFVATISQNSEAVSTVQEQINATDLSGLSEEEQNQLWALLHKFQPVFSAYEGDLGCTKLISHNNLLLSDIPVQQWHRRILPSE